MNTELESIRKRRKMPYVPGLTLTTAQKMINAGTKEADKYGIDVSIALSDSAGNLLAFGRMENATLFSIQIAMDKAYTAVFGKCNTEDWGKRYASGKLVPLFFHERWITFSGGLPLIKDEKVYGGVGVSGAVTEDIYIARAVIKAGGFNLDEVDAAIERIESGNKKE